MDKIQQFLSIGQIISTLLIAITGWIITINFNSYQKKQIEQKFKPYLIITKLVNNSIQISNNELYNDSKVPTVPYSKIKINKSEQNMLYEKFVHKMSKNKNFGTVYHMMYENNRHLVYNFLDNVEDIIFDYASTIIVIKNIGYDLCSYSIDKVKIHYKDNAEKTLNSNENWQPKYVPSQTEFCLLLSMVTNSNKFSLCDISGLAQESKITLDKRVDLLDIDFSNNFLNYNQMEIYFVVKSSLAREYNFKITIEVDGDRLSSFTEEI